MARKRVWFFLDSSLPVDRTPADFFHGTIGLSGSDGTMLRVAHGLAERGFVVSVYNHWWSGTEGGVEFQRVGTAEEFIDQTRAQQPECIIFNYYVARPAALKIAESNLPGTRKLLWDQNGADFRFIALARSGAIDNIIAVSASAREWFRTTSAYHRTRVIYNLCDDAFFRPRPRQPDGRTVLFVGALRPVKGFDALALAWPLVHRAFPNARLLVAGSHALHERARGTEASTVAAGDYDSSVVAPFLSWADNAGARVEFLGTVGPRELVELHSTAVCCIVNPSAAGSGETFCCAAVEAELCGNPVVSIANGSLPEVTQPGVTSLLARVDDQCDLAAKILELLNNRREVATMGARASEFARQQFDREDILNAWEAAVDGRADGSYHRPQIDPARTIVRDLLRITGVGDLRRRRRDLAVIGSAGEFPFKPFVAPC